jgi:geranylgeranyl diphosphate synthase type I
MALAGRRSVGDVAASRLHHICHILLAMTRDTGAVTGEVVAAAVARYRHAIEAGLRAVVDRREVEHASLMRYHFGWHDADGQPTDGTSGKLLRPVLCLLSCEAVGSPAERAMPAAVALELLHNFTLIHDDIEDASDSRHGRPTLWRVAGVPHAINAGDGMFVLAQLALLDLRTAGANAPRTLEAIALLNEAAVRLCEGQHLDMGFEQRATVTMDEYESMAAGKSAALIGASMAMGALAGGADDRTVAAFDRAGGSLGLAFQVQDDVLGVWGDADVTGKPVADDIRARKKSFPAVYAREHLPAADREALDRIYAQAALTGDDVSVALRLFDEAGARDAATAAARAHARDATRALEGLSLVRERLAEIAAVAEFAVRRSA